VFLELEGTLADNYLWRQLHPMQGSVLEGIARLPKQLLGACHQHPPNIILFVEASVRYPVEPRPGKNCLVSKPVYSREENRISFL